MSLQRTHHHQQGGLVHEALEYEAEVHHRAVTVSPLQPAIVGQLRLAAGGTLKSVEQSY